MVQKIRDIQKVRRLQGPLWLTVGKDRHLYPPLAQLAEGIGLKIHSVPIRIRGGGPSSSHGETDSHGRVEQPHRGTEIRRCVAVVTDVD